METVWMFVKAFVVGGLICCVGQALLMHTGLTSARILVLFVVAGVVLGAFLLIGLQDVFREFESARMLIFGAAMMVMMIICPQGLLPPRRRFYNARFLVGRFPRGVQRAEPAREEAL